MMKVWKMWILLLLCTIAGVMASDKVKIYFYKENVFFLGGGGDIFFMFNRVVYLLLQNPTKGGVSFSGFSTVFSPISHHF